MALVANLDSGNVTPVRPRHQAGRHAHCGGDRAGGHGRLVAASGAATAFVADYSSNTVTSIDVATLQAEAAIPVGPGPQTIAAAPGEVLVGNFGNRTLTAINPTTLRAVVGLTVGAPVALPDVAQGIALTADGSTAWVTQQAGTLIPVTLATGTVGGRLHVAGTPPRS